ncbi:hypothetical protein N7463_009925 [Penicillium fimorum]|uniref:Uncharacterized protein n=1 Tax=Penicillium fimorum TaxID=1882269 RepID=A0A9X0C0S4_9EURO|nr:hypothetical protein N7463_009925 [Penicillium fimorum]
MEEAYAHVFFCQEIVKRSNATIQVSEAYHAFEWGNGRGRRFTYIVMEHIEIDFERTASDEGRAQALSELISIPAPLGVFGHFNGGTYRHHLFRDCQPPVPFASTAELEDYVNRVGLSQVRLGGNSLG